MRQRDVAQIMDAKELIEWMSYDMSCDPEFREQIRVEKSMKEQETMGSEEQSNLIRQLFGLPKQCH